MKFPKSISITLPDDIFDFVRLQNSQLYQAESAVLEVDVYNGGIFAFLNASLSYEDVQQKSPESALFYAALSAVFGNKSADLEYDMRVPQIAELLGLLRGLVDPGLLSGLLAQFRDPRRLNFE